MNLFCLMARARGPVQQACCLGFAGFEGRPSTAARMPVCLQFDRAHGQASSDRAALDQWSANIEAEMLSNAIWRQASGP